MKKAYLFILIMFVMAGCEGYRPSDGETAEAELNSMSEEIDNISEQEDVAENSEQNEETEKLPGQEVTQAPSSQDEEMNETLNNETMGSPVVPESEVNEPSSPQETTTNPPTEQKPDKEQEESSMESPPTEETKKPPVAGDWELILEDEFNGDKLNTEIWSKGLVWGGGLGGSGFHDSNVYVQDGQLVIKTEKKDITMPNGKSYSYQSGLIHSMGKFTQKYGYFEVKMTLPTKYGPGFWPAFWLYPDRYVERGLDDLWSNNRRSTYDRNGKGMEIDIIEHLSNWGNGKTSFALHWDEYGPDHKSTGDTISLTENSSHPTKVFGLYWDKGLVIFYVDGKEVGRRQMDRIADVPLFMKLNVATGGWNNNRIDSSTVLPAYTTVDWVRVWRKK